MKLFKSIVTLCERNVIGKRISFRLCVTHMGYLYQDCHLRIISVDYVNSQRS